MYVQNWHNKLKQNNECPRGPCNWVPTMPWVDSLMSSNMDSKYSFQNRVQFQNKIYITEIRLAYSFDKYNLFQKEGSTVQQLKYSCLSRI